MKKRPLILCAAVVLALFSGVWLCQRPGSREIDTALPATEYSFADPDYAVAHTVTIRGTDTRNLLGEGKFVGTFAADGWECPREDQTTMAVFPVPEGSSNVWYEDMTNWWDHTRDLYALQPDRDWTGFVGLLYEHGTPDTKWPDTESGRFLVSGTPTRDEALELAAKLTRGTALEPVFEDR